MNLGGIDGQTQNKGGNMSEKKTYEPLPDGFYSGIIEKVTLSKPSTNGNSVYNELKLAITDGEHKGRKAWDRLFVSGVSPKSMTVSKERTEKIATIASGPEVAKAIQNGEKDLTALEGRPVNFEIKSRNGYTNVTRYSVK